MNHINTKTQGFKVLLVLVAVLSLGVGSAAEAAVFPIIVLQDDFNHASLPGWTAGGPGASGWTDTGNLVRSEDGVGGAANSTTLTRAPSSTVTGDWAVELRYGWVFGSDSVAARTGIAMLDDSGNGYGLYIEQADRNIAIREFTSGVEGALLGFTKTVVDNGGTLTPVGLDWQASTNTLSLYLGTPGGAAGTATTLVGSVVDATTTSFTQFQLRNINAAGFQSIFDDVLVTTVPEPASLALLGFGGLLVIRRRRK